MTFKFVRKFKFLMSLFNIGRADLMKLFQSKAKFPFGCRFLPFRLQNAMATQVEYSSEADYFTDHELDEEDDEVYRISGGPGSIQGIWKKFEQHLIPTPPLSPSRQAVSSGASSPTCLTSSPADTLQTVSDILDIDSSRTTLLFPDNSCPNLKSKLIQDCMWGCREKFQRVAYIENVYDTPCSTPPPLDYVSADCVDPSSVFPYPINNQELPSDDSSSGKSSFKSCCDLFSPGFYLCLRVCASVRGRYRGFKLYYDITRIGNTSAYFDCN